MIIFCDFHSDSLLSDRYVIQNPNGFRLFDENSSTFRALVAAMMRFVRTDQSRYGYSDVYRAAMRRGFDFRAEVADRILRLQHLDEGFDDQSVYSMFVGDEPRAESPDSGNYLKIVSICHRVYITNVFML